MQPEISEFSYGFALTNEVVGWVELFAAPIFPSLVEEGKAGGGYDVKLDQPGAPLYLQFKRSECMVTRRAKEFKSVKSQGHELHVPFYRFPITEAKKSDQHELLLALDQVPDNHVYYAAPRFHRLREINDAWTSSEVASRSIFIAPRDIGPLDDGNHRIAFDSTDTWLCSDPQSVAAFNSREVLERIRATLKEEKRPLRQRLPNLVAELQEAERRGRERIDENRRRAEEVTPDLYDIDHYLVEEDERAIIALPEPDPPQLRDPKPLPPELNSLRKASDIAARVFDAQLIIVQPQN